MEKYVVEANSIVDGKKQPAGKKEIDKPNSLTEAVKVYGSESAFLHLAFRSHVIDTQRQIVNGTGTSDRSVVKALIAKARELKISGDTSLYDQLVHLKVINV